jgi:hypothetical protein
MRHESLPSTLRAVVYSCDITLDIILERVKEYEKSEPRFKKEEKMKSNFRIDKGFRQDRKLEKQCYECQKFRHIAKFCPKKKVKCYKCELFCHYSNECEMKVTNNKVQVLDTGIDERKIKIQNKQYEAVFDTGASESMICSGVLTDLNNIKVKPEVKTYKYFDGGHNKTSGMVELEFEYEGKLYNENFNVVKNNKLNNILLSNNIVKKITEEKIRFPLQCKINTEGKVL